MTANDSDAAPELAKGEARSGDSDTHGTDAGTRRSSAHQAATPTEAQ